MAYDATKPADDEFLSVFPAEMREQLRAIIQDAIVNALTLNGYSPGNLNGNIPLSNGNLNTNLNADKLDGHDATYFSADGHVHAAATQSTNGFMTNTDKTKLDNIAAGAEVNQNSFSNVAVGTETIQADSKTDTLTLAAGANIAITPDATNDKVTIAVTGTVPAAAAAATADRATADAAGNVIADTYLPKSGGTINGNITWTGDKRVYNSDLNSGFFAVEDATGIYDWKNDRTIMQYVQSTNKIYVGDASTATTFAGTVNAPTFSGHLAGTADRATADAGGNVIADTYLPKSGGTMTGDLTVPAIYSSNWFRSQGNSGWYSETYTGGWYMEDSVWVRSFANKSVYTGGRMQADSGFYGNLVGTLNGYTAAQLIGETSHATNGYHKLPGGTIIQWGYAAAPGSYSFPIAFPNACLNVSLTVFAPVVGLGGDNGPVVLTSKSASGFTYADTDDGNNLPASYIAIGY